MRQISRTLQIVVVVLTLALLAKAQSKEASRAEALRVADAWLGAVQAYDQIPAISAGVVAGDKLAWAKGYGTIDPDHKIAASPQTIYSICSISKLFTSISLMQLYESGKVRLDEPVTAYLPWAILKPAPESDSVPITLRGLLSHSAGLPRESDFPYWSGPDFPFPTEEQMKAELPRQALLYPAQRWFQYSNLGITLVGETVQAVSGEPYSQYEETHILKPLGLSDTHTFMPMDLYGKRLAVGYGALERDGKRAVLKPFNTRGITPAAGFTSTVEDLGKFASWQFRLLRSGKEEVLKASTLREMQRVQFVDPDWKTTRGLGFSILHRDNHTYVGHSGDCPGYQTTLLMRPEDELAVIVMDNSSERPPVWAGAIYKIIDKREGFKFKEPLLSSGVSLEDYAGHYSGQPWGSETLILPWAGGLVVMPLPSDDPVDDMSFLKPKGEDHFRRVRDDGSEAEEFLFHRDAGGKVSSFTVFSNTRERLAMPIEPPVNMQNLRVR
jgi:CubicO group peptidase (beta-lactamase class C family)